MDHHKGPINIKEPRGASTCVCVVCRSFMSLASFMRAFMLAKCMFHGVGKFPLLEIGDFIYRDVSFVLQHKSVL